MDSKTALTVKQLGAQPLKNLQHEKFCLLYATDPNFMGSGVKCYAEVYQKDLNNPSEYGTSKTGAQHILKKPTSLARINHFLDLTGFNDINADKQLTFLMNQMNDLRVKAQAIKEYNALRGRVKRKLELSFEGVSDDELDRELQEIEAELAEAEQLGDDRDKPQKAKGGLNKPNT